MSHRYKDLGTGEVWLCVQRELRASAARPRLGAADSEVEIWDLVNAAMQTALAALESVEEGVSDPYGTLAAAHSLLIEAWRKAVTAGLTTAADGIAVLADRVAAAFQSIGSSGATVFHEFLGGSPLGIGAGVMVLSALGIGAAAWVLTGSGGQAALATLAQRQIVL